MKPLPCVNILYIDLDSYFASVEQQDDPRLRGNPVAVTPSREISPSATCIAASYEAKAFGVRTGTRVQEARHLCPGIAFRAARHDRYVTVHHEVKMALDRILPVEKTCSIDEFASVLTGPQRELSQAIFLARAVKESIALHAGEYLGVSIGLGANMLLAKIAAEMEKPNALAWIVPGEEREKLSRLSLRALPGISHGMETRLAAAGVETVEALLDLAPRHARMIWGSVQGERFLRRLHGEAIPDVATRRRMIGHSQILVPQSRSADEARNVVRRLLAKAASRLRRMGFFATRLSLGVKYPFDGRERRETGFRATQDTFMMMRALESLWRSLPQRGVCRSVSVALHGLVPEEEYIPDLFDEPITPGTKTRSTELSALVDGLNQRYGRDTLTYGAPPASLAPYTGAKIAFDRVPEPLEFKE